MITFKVLAALLAYPDQELLDAIPQMLRVLDQERLLPARERQAVDILLDELRGSDMLHLQEAYTGLFDRTRSLCLHLFEHVHGESRDRGQALVDLRNLYASHGLILSANELPDYLPVFLEFLSRRPMGDAREMLRDTAHILRGIGARLAGRNSAYAAVFGALLTLAGEKGLETPRPLAPERHGEDLAALDKEWGDAPVTFGPAPGGPQEAAIQFYPRAAAANR